jgi:WD40 repeat protein
VWDATGHEVRHLFCRPKNIETYNAVLSVDGRLVANTDAGGMIRFWETETGKNVDSMRGGHNPFCGIALSTDARFVGNPDWQLLRIFRTQPGEKIWQTQANPWPFQSAVFAADNLTVFSGDQAGTIREWTVANGREFRTLQPHPELVACPPRMGQPHPSPRPGHMHSVRGMAISPDGRRLVSVGDEATVRLWELASGGECALVAKADQLPAATLVAPGIPITFSGDGNMIATPGLDSHRRRIIDVWDSRTGAQIATFEGHRAAITALSFSPDGRRLISGGMDTIGYIWEVPPIKRERIETIPDGAANSLWHELADDDAAKAYRAISKWLSAPDFAIEYLRRSFVPATAINAERVDKLVVDLDSDKFAVRDNASRELSLLGPGVHDHLKRALRTSPSLEVTRRIEALLAVKSDEGLRRRRAIEIVEAIGTPAAESLLKDWSAANPDSVTAKDANAALGRLRRR